MEAASKCPSASVHAGQIASEGALNHGGREGTVLSMGKEEWVTTPKNPRNSPILTLPNLTSSCQQPQVETILTSAYLLLSYSADILR